MTESDDLLSKADALLARWRSGAKAPEPPQDYPVLTEAIEDPEAADLEIPHEPEVPALDSPATAREAEPISIPESPDAPALEVPPAPAGASTGLAPIEADLPPSPTLGATPGRRAADIDVRGLEERVRLRVLDAIEPQIAALLEEPLRLRIDDAARRCAADIAKNARDDILAVVHEAVRSALAQELGSQRDERGGR